MKVTCDIYNVKDWLFLNRNSISYFVLLVLKMDRGFELSVNPVSHQFYLSDGSRVTIPSFILGEDDRMLEHRPYPMMINKNDGTIYYKIYDGCHNIYIPIDSNTVQTRGLPEFKSILFSNEFGVLFYFDDVDEVTHRCLPREIYGVKCTIWKKGDPIKQRTKGR
jgi:hypothetical protein